MSQSDYQDAEPQATPAPAPTHESKPTQGFPAATGPAPAQLARASAISSAGNDGNGAGLGQPAVAHTSGQALASNSPQARHAAQLQSMVNSSAGHAPIQRKSNGLPNQLRNGVEQLSGLSMGDVNVHYNSSKPAQLKAHAYAQGTNIHLGPGQEKHLAHEAWHVVQQKQNRVKPTIQMKAGVPVNDDAGLEREADEMGAKAARLGATLPAGGGKQFAAGAGSGSNIIQGKVMAGTFRELLVEQEQTDELLTQAGMGLEKKIDQIVAPIPAMLDTDQPKLLEQIKAQDLGVPDLVSMRYFINRYVAEFPLEDAEAGFTENLWPAFLVWLGEKIGKKHVTAGFEFEFASMAEDNPFQGVSHLELSRSTEKINRLPFVLETDAGNALEFVTPPLWLEALDNDTPLPLVADVKKVDQIIKDYLKGLVAQDLKLEAMTTAMGVDPGLTFPLADAKVQAHNLSPASFGKYTEGNDTVPTQSVKDIMVGPITKYQHGGIDSQLNFATDADVYAQAEAVADQSRRKKPFVGQFYDLQDHLAQAMGVDTAEGKLADFLWMFARNVAGQLAVPAMKYLRTIQAEAFATGATVTKGDLSFGFYAWASSGVKDIGNIWIKDNLINIGISMLSMAEWGQVHDLTESKAIGEAIRSWKVPDALRDLGLAGVIPAGILAVQRDNLKKYGAYYDQAKPLMHGAVTTLGQAIKHFELDSKETDRMVETPATDFLDHDPQYIGPRQDTHLPARLVQLPAWQKRLFVMEVRSNPAASLEAITARVLATKEATAKKKAAAARRLTTPYLVANDTTNALLKKHLKKLQLKEFIVKQQFLPQLRIADTSFAIYTTRMGNIPTGELKAKMLAVLEAAWPNQHPIEYIATSADFAQYD